ncbi:MAG: hypothetical protein ABIH03_05160, partial [Pseudomonadota bacterium]
MAETLVIPLAVNASFPNPALAEIYDPEAFGAHDQRWPSERYARRPVADELQNVIALLIGGVGGIRVRNNTGGAMVAGNLVYVSGFAGIIEEGDASTQLSSWVITGTTLRNTAQGRLWWTLENSGTTRTVELYRHINLDGTFPTEALVASGSRSGDGSITITEENSSGIAGSVTVAYTVDDTDSANVLYLDVHDITLADADAVASFAQYVLLDDIDDAAHGFAYLAGEVAGIDTSGASAAGSTAWLSGTSGAFAWSAGTHPQRIGICTYKDASDGRILFICPGRFGTLPDGSTLAFDGTTGLLEIKDAGITAAKLANAVADEILTASLTVGSEATGDEISVTIQVKDVQGNAVSKEVLLEVWVADSTTGWECTTAPNGGVTFTTGVAA